MPASAVAVGLIVNTIVSTAALQGPVGSSVVKVSVTLHVEISDEPGV